jgi:ribonucleoside-diphosphate reductase alpha chain
MGMSAQTAAALRRELLPSPTPEPAGSAANAPQKHEHEEPNSHPHPEATPSPLAGEGQGGGKAAASNASSDKAAQVAAARMKGYEGESCNECGNFTMVRNGTCLKCDTCGATSGCS